MGECVVRTMVRFVAVAAVAVVLGVLAGCTSQGPAPDREPVLTPLPTAAAEHSELVCGVERESVETATGLAVGRSESELTVRGGIGAGTCRAWAKNESLVVGPLLFVVMGAASSADGLDARARLDGDRFRPPDLLYTSVDGGVWGDLELQRRSISFGAVSFVFWGDTLINLGVSRGEEGRSVATDLLALTQQVATTYGLPDAS